MQLPQMPYMSHPSTPYTTASHTAPLASFTSSHHPDIPILLGPRYSIPPTPVIAKPTHHNRSAFTLCTTSCLTNLSFQFNGTSLPFAVWYKLLFRLVYGDEGSNEFGVLRLTFGFEVAPPDALVEAMGLRVVVGSIWGGV